jgi:hypothetical protein
VKESGELTALTLIGNFVSVSFGSIGVGVVVALLCCFLFKKNDLSKLPAYEYLLTFLFAYASYCASEIVGLSGIMALFFCGIVLSHYNYYNLSPIAKSSMKHIFHAMTLVAETFLFAYLGITAAVSLEPHFNLQWSLSLIFWTIVYHFLIRVYSKALDPLLHFSSSQYLSIFLSCQSETKTESNSFYADCYVVCWTSWSNCFCSCSFNDNSFQISDCHYNSCRGLLHDFCLWRSHRTSLDCFGIESFSPRLSSSLLLRIFV